MTKAEGPAAIDWLSSGNEGMAVRKLKRVQSHDREEVLVLG